MNKVILMGYLTRDPDIRYSQDGKAVAGFSIAVKRKYVKDKEKDADFFSCSAFGKTAEFVEKYLSQGSRILVTGRIQNDNYTNRDGEKVFAVRIMVEELEFAESKQKTEERKEPKPSPVGDDFVNIPEGIDEELPFV